MLKVFVLYNFLAFKIVNYKYLIKFHSKTISLVHETYIIFLLYISAWQMNIMNLIDQTN